MKQYIDPGHKRKALNLIDNVVYATRTDLEGNLLELKLSVLLQNGNSEQKLAIGEDDPPGGSLSQARSGVGFPAAAGAAQTKT